MKIQHGVWILDGLSERMEVKHLRCGLELVVVFGDVMVFG